MKTEKLEAKYMWLANYYNEKAKVHGVRLIHWFENIIPKQAIKATVHEKTSGDGN